MMPQGDMGIVFTNENDTIIKSCSGWAETSFKVLGETKKEGVVETLQKAGNNLIGSQKKLDSKKHNEVYVDGQIATTLEDFSSYQCESRRYRITKVNTTEVDSRKEYEKAIALVARGDELTIEIEKCKTPYEEFWGPRNIFYERNMHVTQCFNVHTRLILCCLSCVATSRWRVFGSLFETQKGWQTPEKLQRI